MAYEYRCRHFLVCSFETGLELIATCISVVSAPISNSRGRSQTLWMSNVRRAGHPVTTWLKYTCC